MKMKWWEKTVEYYFVKNYLSDSSIAPLDGNQELGGDAIYAHSGKFVLIEFKRDNKSIESERSKFYDFDGAQNDLKNKDAHHFIIYGIYDKKFKLKARTYFSGKVANINDALNQGVAYEEFNEYLKKLINFKKKKGGGTGGGIELSSYEIVAMVSNKGDVVSCMTMSEYILEHGQVMGFDQEQSSDPEQYNGPSMGM